MMSRVSSKLGTAARAAALLAGLALDPPGSAGAAPATPAAPAVSVVEAVPGSLAETVVLSGTLVARDEVLVSPAVEGLRVVELLAEEGDRVAEGQVLARLDRAAVEARAAQAEASVARADAAIAQARSQVAEANATRVQAQAQLERARALKANGNTSQQALDDREATARIAAARVEAAGQALRVAEADRAVAEAQLRQAAVDLTRTEVIAPRAGLVTRRTATLGAVAAMAGDPLFRLAAGGEVELRAEVPETSLARLRAGQPALVRPAGLAQPIAGTVRLVSPEVDETTRLGRVRIALPPDGLAVGAFARATVEVERREGVLVPLSAVLFRADGPRVQVVKGDLVETRAVQLGLRADGRAEVRANLAAGERVVAVSGTFVRDGDRVTPVPLKN